MRRRPYPPPQRFTALDACHIVLGLLMVPLGIIILARTVAIAVSPMGLLVGVAFVAFGIHRGWLAWSRYRLYRRNRGNAV